MSIEIAPIMLDAKGIRACRFVYIRRLDCTCAQKDTGAVEVADAGDKHAGQFLNRYLGEILVWRNDGFTHLHTSHKSQGIPLNAYRSPFHKAQQQRSRHRLNSRWPIQPYAGPSLLSL